MAKGGSGGKNISVVGGGGGISAPESSNTLNRKVNNINRLANGDGGRAEMREEFDKMEKGTVLSTITEGDHGLIENKTTWKKTNDDTWKGDNGIERSTSDMIRDLKNNPHKLTAGEVSTESKFEVTGKYGKAYDGIKYASGNFDILRTDQQRQYSKVNTNGKVTEFKGRKYGVTGDRGDYRVTDVASGMAFAGSIGTKLKSMNDVSSAIKNFNDHLSDNAKTLKSAEEIFKKARRGDSIKRR